MRFGVAIVVVVMSGCLFPTLDELTSSHDASIDVAVVDASDAGSDAAKNEAGCAIDTDPSLVLYYPFDEGSGSTIHDCSSHGFNGVLASANADADWTTGHEKGAIKFTPTNGTCVIVSSPNANQLGSFTIGAWTMLTDPAGGYAIGQRTQLGYAWRLVLDGVDAGVEVDFAIGIGDGTMNDNYADGLTQLNEWHYVAAVYNAQAVTETVYVDGVKTLSPSPPPPQITADPIASTIRVGCRGDNMEFYPGLIDEVRVYSRALSDTEVASLASK